MMPVDRFDMDNVKRHVLSDYKEPPYTSEIYEYSKFLVKIPNIPEYMRKQVWAMINRVNALSNLKDLDIRYMMREADSLLTLIRSSMPEYEYTPELDYEFQQLEMMFFLTLNRSKEGFERKMQATQIKQVFYSQDEVPKPKTGFLGRFFGIGGGQRR